MTKNQVENPKIVSHAEWVTARKELLAKEKQLTHDREAVAALRRELPWVRVEKKYTFDAPGGKESLADLFGGRSQLVVYHFMFGPGWEEGCPSCSFISDTINPNVVHLAQRDVTLLAVSRAPLAKIEAFKKRMGWHFKWVSSFDTDFNYDFQASHKQDGAGATESYYNYTVQEFPSEERPGASVFYKNAKGEIFHTYSVYARGLDPLIGAYHYLDMVPKGRNEEGLPHGMAWVRLHDKYGAGIVGAASLGRPR